MSNKKKPIKGPYQYGKHPNPTNWHEAADALKSYQKPKSKLSETLDLIAKQLKDKK